MSDVFKGSFTQQEPIPEAGIDAAVAVMRHGRLHRYNTVAGETAQTVLLEQEFAASVGAKYCLAVASGGYAMATALRAVGVKAGDRVLTNAFTLAPVPGAIAAVGAVPVFVGVTPQLVLDLDDLAAKADQATVLLLSHMRGHICDMERLMHICARAGVTMIEDCAHTMGAAWKGKPSGTWGTVGCYSCQTYKHINSGEGGLLITDDAQIAARAIMYSGSYMLYESHQAGPPKETFETIRFETPNISGRMDNLRAAILRPQLADLPTQCARWNERYLAVENDVAGTVGLTVIQRPAEESFVGSSIQFLLPDWTGEAVQQAVARCAARGVELKWFGGAEPVGFTSRYDSWRYVNAPAMPKSDQVLAGIIDMRVPLTFSLEDCAQIGRIIREEVSRVYQASR
ncbi:DegT/DnrJ/EryC1/StrS family aminotransferase [Sulfitobacter sp. F26169L]|uniref:DegT/DnrJ/EryC1/StrS family aminotransferase n=1 Tax=Sulfitobacter sp. F26169L TaxID=2996015 RepID=UPI002260D5F6|nr:DegT/DnrJ/EryC1/StrS family aminotransferase [Sulfitobacter sp. F26169L]MCX7566272.1 DegT/DnrJ/EryC1/StrS family aminotransferase [Sulfitobacter sp. F26169L]